MAAASEENKGVSVRPCPEPHMPGAPTFAMADIVRQIDIQEAARKRVIVLSVYGV